MYKYFTFNILYYYIYFTLYLHYTHNYLNNNLLIFMYFFLFLKNMGEYFVISEGHLPVKRLIQSLACVSQPLSVGFPVLYKGPLPPILYSR